MEILVRELISKIRRDGIDAASEEAARIKQEAENDAKQIVEAAKKEAADIIAKGKKDAERAEKAGRAALEQASRNLVLAFRGEIQALLDQVINAQLGVSYSGDVLKAALPDIIKSWGVKNANSLALLLPEASLDKLKSFFKDKLAAELKKGLELKSDPNLVAGFRIAKKDGSAYYDFSADSVAEMLSAYLNPQLAEILKSSVKDLQKEE